MDILLGPFRSAVTLLARSIAPFVLAWSDVDDTAPSADAALGAAWEAAQAAAETVVASLLAVVAAIAVVRHVMASARVAHMARVAKRKRQERDAAHDAFKASYAGSAAAKAAARANDAAIGMSATELRAAYSEGTVTPFEAVALFSDKACTAGERFGCNAEECFDDALIRAEDATRRFKATGFSSTGRHGGGGGGGAKGPGRGARGTAAGAKGRGKRGASPSPRVDDADATRSDSDPTDGLGLLEGVPISVKDQYHQAGFDSTAGLASKCFDVQDKDGLLIELLRDQGAIPFVRSNVPQALLVPETECHIWGRATNPYDTQHTPGGSSGGEAALVGSGASPLGIGSDIGGSLRTPAHFCGLYTLKPTPGRITAMGVRVPRIKPYSGQEGIKSCLGPMGRCTNDCALVMRSWLVEKMWHSDPTVPRLPFRMSVYAGTRKLRVGFYDSDGYVDPTPGCRRAVHEAVDALRGNPNIELVPWSPPDVARATLLYNTIMSADAMQGLLDSLEGEATIPLYRVIMAVSRLPRMVRRVLAPVLRAVGQTRTARVVAAGGWKYAGEWWDAIGQRDMYKRELFASWREAGLDAVIAPGLGTPAFKCGQHGRVILALSYVFLWNLCAMPAGVVPVTRTREGETEAYAPTDPAQQDVYVSQVRSQFAGSSGLPCGVQVAALPNDDEVVLRVMRELEQAVGFNVGPHAKEWPSCAAK